MEGVWKGERGREEGIGERLREIGEREGEEGGERRWILEGRRAFEGEGGWRERVG